MTYQPPRPSNPLVPSAPDSAVQLAALEARLTDGDARIVAAAAHGLDIAAWESFWVHLLHEYEALAVRIADDVEHDAQAA